MTTPLIVDASVHPYPRSNEELREWLPPAFRDRGIPDVELPWYQAPGGDHHPSTLGSGQPGSDPAEVSRAIFDEMGCAYAVLNPLTRGNLPDRLLNSAVCAATNDWLSVRWLREGNRHGCFRGTIRVNPEDVAGSIAEIERWRNDPMMIQVGVPLQSREPYGKPQFWPIWEAAANRGLPVAVLLNGGAGVEYPPTPAGHARTYPNYAAFVPLNGFVHLSSLIVEGVFERYPELVFVFSDGGSDVLTPLMWRLDSFWRPFRDQTPWVTQMPSAYVRNHVRFGFSRLEGPPDKVAPEWFELDDKSDLLLYCSHYPRWSLASPSDLPQTLAVEQRARILAENALALYGLARPS